MNGRSIPAAHIASRIVIVRGQKALLDSDLAELYGVTTSALIQGVRRNPRRFPPDFLFRLSDQEVAILKSQSVISRSPRWGGRRAPIHAFTEQGVANAQLEKKLEEVEQRVTGHDEAITSIVRAIRELAAQPAAAPRRSIGFV